MECKKAGGTRWGPCFLGWAVAVFTGLVVSRLLRLLYSSLSELAVGRGELTATLVVISLVAGFLSYLIRDNVAARAAGCSGGKHGALAAVLGLIVGLALAVVLGLFGIVFAEGAALPPVGFGLAGAALLAGILLFLTNLFGGFVGGKLGEPPATGGTRKSSG